MDRNEFWSNVGSGIDGSSLLDAARRLQRAALRRYVPPGLSSAENGCVVSPTSRLPRDRPGLRARPRSDLWSVGAVRRNCAKRSQAREFGADADAVRIGCDRGCADTTRMLRLLTRRNSIIRLLIDRLPTALHIKELGAPRPPLGLFCWKSGVVDRLRLVHEEELNTLRTIGSNQAELRCTDFCPAIE
jgi:hypothetical protein